MKPKALFNCCGYVAALGPGAPWSCPSCGTAYEAEAAGEPEPYVGISPQALGAQTSLPALRGLLPGL